jgi:fatty-acyl-CoA synthase
MESSSLFSQIRRAARIARSGARIFKNAGFIEALNARAVLAAAETGVQRLRGVKGAAAIIHLHASADPLRPAVVDGQVRLNYGELEARVNRLTHGLASLGVGLEDKVGVFLFNSHEHIELSSALAIIGARSVQIGHRLKEQEVAYILEHSGARVLVFHAELAPVVEEALTLVKNAPIARERCIVAGNAPGFRNYEELVTGGEAAAPVRVSGGGYGGIMIYTSGTTGRAKGATRSFEKMGLEPVLDYLSQLPLRRDERHLVVCPMYHSMAAAFSTIVMMVGGCSVLTRHFDAEEVLRAIERERITSILVVPTMLSRLLALGPEVLRRHDTSSLRWIMSGAAPLPTEVARRTEDTFGPILYNFYGATETGIVTIALPGEHTARPGTIGRLVCGNEVRLIDAAGRDVPDGEVGELYARNEMMMDGYHKNDKATRDASRDGFISVGDLAYRDADGYYYLADRKSDMVISGGVNIYPAEIEQRLHAHPSVHEVAVVGVPDPEWGESLVAFVVLREGKSAGADELGQWVKEALADYKRPRRFLFVDALPRTPTGKVLKRELKARLAASSQPQQPNVNA